MGPRKGEAAGVAPGGALKVDQLSCTIEAKSKTGRAPAQVELPERGHEGVDAFAKPIAAAAVPTVVERLAGHHARETAWRDRPCLPWTHNLWLIKGRNGG